MRQKQQFESESHNNKVKDLENKLKEQEQEFESQPDILQHKVLILKHITSLKFPILPEECILLCQKIKELEDKIKEQEQQLACMFTDSDAKSLRSSPLISKCSSRDDLTSDIEKHILKSSNAFNLQASHGSNLLKGKDSVQ